MVGGGTEGEAERRCPVLDCNLAPHYHFYTVDDGTLTDFDADPCAISDVPALPEGTAHAGIDVIVRVCNKPRAP